METASISPAAKKTDLPQARVAAMLAPLGEHELTLGQQAGEERP